ncbi:hypothetical protein GOBAR_AA24764 [Gossypium barbadense]|uniref:Uncharacterized protein n=1 Tax=Gossypium barbadense TaxID=3634 RepID=A0A2P5WXU3_GOSBA|nr:hypothetical protein GOBAR_AA24764 [Gossypium barbadense]
MEGNNDFAPTHGGRPTNGNNMTLLPYMGEAFKRGRLTEGNKVALLLDAWEEVYGRLTEGGNRSPAPRRMGEAYGKIVVLLPCERLTIDPTPKRIGGGLREKS